MTRAKLLQGLFDGLLFKILYLILTLLSFNAFTYYQPFMKYLVVIVTAFGLFNCLYRVIYYKKFIKIPHLLFLGLFFFSYLISVLVNYQYGLLGSAKSIIWMALQFGLLFIGDITKSQQQVMSEFKKIGVLLVVYNAVSCVISVLMAFVGYGKVFLNGELHLRGFVWGRLWGIYTDPNYGSFSVCISAIICLYLISQSTRLYQKAVGILPMIFYFLYIVLSDSRTGYVVFICLMACWGFIRFYLYINSNSFQKDFGVWVKRGISVTISLVIVFSVFSAMLVTKSGYNAIAEFMASKQVASQIQQTEQTEQTQQPQQPEQINRNYDEVSAKEAGISNRRFDLWQSGIELFCTSPIVGIGFRNFQAVAKDRVPDTYLIHNSLGAFNAFHNMWVDLLVSQGLLGALLFIILTFLCAKDTINLLKSYIKNNHPDCLWVCCLFIAILISLVASLFLSDILNVNSPNAMMFWTILGYLMIVVYNHQHSAQANQLNRGE